MKKKDDCHLKEFVDSQTGLFDGKYKIGDKIGQGGAGCVWKAWHVNLKVNHAIKQLKSRTENIQFDLFAKTFEDEIKILSKVTHKNIIKILDFGPIGSNQSFHRYYVMEYIDGGDLNNIIDTLIDPNDLLQIITDVLEGLCYLHARNILHGDIKPSNILVTFQEEPTRILEAKIADLGVAKPISKTDIDQLSMDFENDSTYIFGSERYSPKYARKFIKNETTIKRGELGNLFPYLDLYCLGATLAEIISEKKIDYPASDELETLFKCPKPIFKQLPEDLQDYLKAFIKLLVVEAPEKGFQSAQEARDAFYRMEPRKLVAVQVPEVTEIGSRFAITHGGSQMRYSKRAYDLISHPTFQRLLNLNQLAFIYLIYPDAKHSRFSHSLRTFDLAVRISRHLLGDHVFRLHMGPKELSLFLCTALLHDIGHFPLAHVIEDLRDTRGISLNSSEPTKNPNAKADFEMLNFYFSIKIEGCEDTLSQRLFKSWNIDSQRIVAILNKQVKVSDLSPSESLIRQLMDSAIDIDKLSYLEADSKHSGVSYGSGIDIDSLISSMVCLSPNSRPSVDRLRIGLSSKGISAAESLIVGRYHMFSKVYWHHTNRSIMAMTMYVAKKVFSTGKFGFTDFINSSAFFSDIEALRFLSEKYSEYFSIEKDYHNPISGIVDGTRVIYKRFVSFSSHPSNNRVREIHEMLGHSSDKDLEGFRQQIIKILEKYYGEKILDSFVLFDVPQLAKEKDSLSETFIVDPIADGGVIKLQDVSQLLKAVHDDFKKLVKKSRVFVNPILRDQLRKMEKEDSAREEVISYLYGITKQDT